MNFESLLFICRAVQKMRRKKKRGKKRPLRYAIIQGELNRINKNNDPIRLNLYLALCFCVACQEKEMEKQKILYQQARLHARGAAEMVLQMISASKGNRESDKSQVGNFKEINLEHLFFFKEHKQTDSNCML